MNQQVKHLSMRIMRILDIEKDHLRHKQRLAEIRGTTKIGRSSEQTNSKSSSLLFRKRKRAANEIRVKIDQ
jgi:hypothetical protein